MLTECTFRSLAMDKRDEEIAKAEQRLANTKKYLERQMEELADVRSNECSPYVAFTLYRSWIEGILLKEKCEMEMECESVEQEKKLAKQEREQRRHC